MTAEERIEFLARKNLGIPNDLDEAGERDLQSRLFRDPKLQGAYQLAKVAARMQIRKESGK